MQNLVLARQLHQRMPTLFIHASLPLFQRLVRKRLGPSTMCAIDSALRSPIRCLDVSSRPHHQSSDSTFLNHQYHLGLILTFSHRVPNTGCSMSVGRISEPQLMMYAPISCLAVNVRSFILRSPPISCRSAPPAGFEPAPRVSF